MYKVRIVHRDLYYCIPSTPSITKVHDLLIHVLSLLQYPEEEASKYGLYLQTQGYWMENDRLLTDYYPFDISSSNDENGNRNSISIVDNVIELQQRMNFVKAGKFYCEGYLLKKGKNSIFWKKRYFVLRDSMLYYYSSSNRQNLIGTIDLNLVKFEIGNFESIDGFCLVSAEKIYRFSGDTEDWIRVLRKVYLHLRECDDSDMSDDDLSDSTSIYENCNNDINLLTNSSFQVNHSNRSKSTGSSCKTFIDIECDKTGFLAKKGSVNPFAKRRLFVLKDTVMLYFKPSNNNESRYTLKNSDYELTGLVNLEGCHLYKYKSPSYYWIGVHSPSKYYKLSTNDYEEWNDWIEAFEQICDLSALELEGNEEEIPNPTKELRLRFNRYIPALEGILWKQGNDKLKKFRKRWFVLLGRSLFYCKINDKTKPLGSIPLRACKLDVCALEKRIKEGKGEFLFKLNLEVDEVNEKIIRTYILKSDTLAVVKTWVEHLSVHCGASVDFFKH